MTTDEERTKLLTRLGQQAEALRTTQGWQRWLKVASRFRSYSLHNQLLIDIQRPDATAIAGYRAWQQLGRQVRRGERGIAIFAPTTRRVEDEADEPKRVLTGFRLVRVFDISQTDGEPLVGEKLPDVIVPDSDLFDRLLAVVKGSGQVVNLVDDHQGSSRGWCLPDRSIAVVTSYDAASRSRTLLHELGHVHDPQFGQRSRLEAELIAEAVAYIVGTGLFGIGMDEASTLYVTSWQGTTERLMHLASDVLTDARAVEALVAPAIRQAAAA